MTKKWHKKHKKSEKNTKKWPILGSFFCHFFFEKKWFFMEPSIPAPVKCQGHPRQWNFCDQNLSDPGLNLKITFWKILILSTENGHFWKKKWFFAKNALFGPPRGVKTGWNFYHHETEEFTGRGFGVHFWHI